MNKLYDINPNKPEKKEPVYFDTSEREMNKLEIKHQYEKKLLILFTEHIKQKGVDRNHITLLRAAKKALLLNIFSPEDLSYLQILGSHSIHHITKQEDMNAKELRKKHEKILGLFKEPEKK